ncbi:unnamed protein product [Adineta ricciae]|uniref:G-protein coupled receptors family 1 profile domain-containing protein n=1 Tax=Adineta ricciae TaxID=249248 RepID=A0A815WQH7_ADIRI|nr:unnamed protein product [Adineta ricciae]CAF1629444.1 unnamed protein product [Adineta ricciae]
MLSSIAFTIISIASTSFTILITLPIIIILYIRLHRERVTVILLSTNTYMGLLTFSIILLSTNINVLRADLSETSLVNTGGLTACQLLGFLVYERFGCCYSSFVLQALSRLLKVLYPKGTILQSFTFNLVCIVIQWIVCFLLLLPSYIWRDLFYSLYELDYYCGIRYERLFYLWYVIFNIYVLPLTYMAMIYIRLMYHIRRGNLQLLQTQRGRSAQRNYVVIRRILCTMTVLALAGLPNVGLAILAYIKPNLSGYYYMYRIQWMVPAITMCTISIVLVFITPQLKKVIMNAERLDKQVMPT